MATPMKTGTYLDRILVNTVQEVTDRKKTISQNDLEAQIRAMPAPVSFANALRAQGVSIIAEIKRASPSKGVIVGDIDVGQITSAYLEGGASSISVLTDRKFFQGSLDDLNSVAGIALSHSTPVPVLRKDFIIDPYQLYESRAARADAILLIVAALEDSLLVELNELAHDLRLGVLMEVHDENELSRALDVGPGVVGINNRDLRTFEVDLAVAERLAPKIPDDVVRVGESGIHSADDVQRLARAGVDAVLVGESLMRQADRAQAVRRLHTP